MRGSSESLPPKICRGPTDVMSPGIALQELGARLLCPSEAIYILEIGDANGRWQELSTAFEQYADACQALRMLAQQMDGRMRTRMRTVFLTPRGDSGAGTEPVRSDP